MARQKRETDETLVLTPFPGEPKERKFAVVDIEARDWVHAYAVGFYDGENFVRFESPRHKDGRLMGQGQRRPSGHLRRGIKQRRLHTRDFRDCRYEFLRWLFSTGPQYSGYWIYAHNGGNYDFIFFLRRLIKEFARRGYETEVTLVGSCALAVTIVDPERDDGGNVIYEAAVDEEGNPKLDGAGKQKLSAKAKYTWKLVDSVRLIPGRLDDIGEAFGSGRKVNLARELGIPDDAGSKKVYRELSRPEHRVKMWHYCEVDCKVLFESLKFFQAKIMSLGGQIGMTLPATSMDVWRRGSFFPRTSVFKNWHIDNCGGEAKGCWGCGIRYNQRWMRGGRTEIFNTLFETTPAIPFASYVDINSHYPNCMLEDMPVGSAQVIEGGTEASIWKNVKQGFIGAIHCQIFIPEGAYLPPLPFRHNGKLTFPAGHLVGVWDACELALLEQVGGRIEKVFKQVWYQGAPIFADLILTLYKLRDKNAPGWSKAMDQIAKLLMNSLFGKMAIKELRERLMIGWRGSRDGMCDFDPESDALTDQVIIKPDYLMPQVAGHITSLARSRLWTYDQAVVKAGGTLYYNDTDSLVLAGVDPAKVLPLGGKLGELKLEHDKVVMCRFILPKLYAFACASPAPGHERPPTKDDCICYRDWWKKRIPGERWEPLSIKAKGLSGGLDDRDLEEAEFWRWTDLSIPEAERTIIRRRLAKTKESLTAFVAEGTLQRDFPYTVEQVKVLRSTYDKRRIVDGAGKTASLVLGSPEEPCIEEFRGRSEFMPDAGPPKTRERRILGQRKKAPAKIVDAFEEGLPF